MKRSKNGFMFGVILIGIVINLNDVKEKSLPFFFQKKTHLNKDHSKPSKVDIIRKNRKKSPKTPNYY